MKFHKIETGRSGYHEWQTNNQRATIETQDGVMSYYCEVMHKDNHVECTWKPTFEEAKAWCEAEVKK